MGFSAATEKRNVYTGWGNMLSCMFGSHEWDEKGSLFKMQGEPFGDVKACRHCNKGLLTFYGRILSGSIIVRGTAK